MDGQEVSTGDNPSPLAAFSHSDVEHPAARAVIFPEDDHIREEKIGGGARPKGVEMKRTITQEEKDLAAAGYEHLRPQVPKDDGKHVDIHEHQLSYNNLEDELKTTFDTKDPGQSYGLTSDEAKARLKRDGPNVLTPPKKKSALRKVLSPHTVLCTLCLTTQSFSFWRDSSPCSTFS